MYHSDKKDTCDKEIRDVIWFKEQLSKRLNKEIEVEEIGHESILLEHDDADAELISKEKLQLFPNPFLAHSFIYEDENDAWICVVVTDESNQGIYYEGWFNDSGEVEWD